MIVEYGKFMGAPGLYDGSIIDQVQTYADIPADANKQHIFMVAVGTGVWGMGRKKRGLYAWNPVNEAWEYGGIVEIQEMVETYMSEAMDEQAAALGNEIWINSENIQRLRVM